MSSAAVAAGIFTITFSMVMFHPRGINEGTAGLVGAVLTILFGLVNLSDIQAVFMNTGGILIMLLAMMVISIIVDEAGFFEWIAVHSARLAKGSGIRLFLSTFLMGTLVTTVISNDATALIITPIVYSFVVKLGINPLPFLLVCTFIADTASLSLPVSNLTNLLAYEQLGMEFIPYCLALFLPTVAAVIVNYLVFRIVFSKDIPQTIDSNILPDPKSCIKHPAFFRFAAWGLIVIIIGYIVGSSAGIPLAYIAIAGALTLMMAGVYYQQIEVKQVFNQVSWSILVFVIGMFIVVKGIQNTGLPTLVAQWLLDQVDGSLFKGLLYTTYGTAIGSNLINNVPMDMMMISILQEFPVKEWLHPLGYAVVMGAGLGPNLTVIGSLATMLWLGTVRRKGVSITALDYFKIGLITTPLMILASVVALYISLLLLGV